MPCIEVLAGMHHHLGEPIGFPDRPADRGRLDELRTGTDDCQDFQRHRCDLTNLEVACERDLRSACIFARICADRFAQAFLKSRKATQIETVLQADPDPA